MLRVFIGTDSRQPVAASVLAHSLRRSSVPVSITMLRLHQLPIKRTGLTEFTYSRFLVPWLCDYKGTSLFLDADMLCLGDIAELFEYANDEKHNLYVVKNKQKFEWPSMMLFNNNQCWKLTPEMVDAAENIFSLEQWADVGELPPEWNVLVGYDEPRSDAKLVHYTQGIPVWKETAGCDFAEEWHNERKVMMSTCSFESLMGDSVHPVAKKVKDEKHSRN